MRTADRGGRATLRWFLLGTGPVKRGSDRLEMVFRLMLLLAVLAAAPVGLVQATASYDAEGLIGPQQARDHHPVQAVVVADPPDTDLLPPDATVQAPVTFTAPDGTPTSATAAVFAATHAQDRITVWVSADGQVTGPPTEAPRSLAPAVETGTLTGLTVPAAAWALLGLAHLALEGRRSRQWQREWLLLEPVWTCRKP